MSKMEYPIEKAQKLAMIGDQAAQDARQELLTAMHDAGITSQVMATVGLDLLHATKQKAILDPKTKQFRYSKPMPDNTTRLNTFKLVCELNDVMPSKKLDINDKRQTLELAGQLFARMEERGLLGVGDKTMPLIDESEAQLMADMAKNKK